MSNKTVIKARQKQKLDSYSNWQKAGAKGFIPLKGEFIIYSKEDLDETGRAYQKYASEKIKIGDGVTTVDRLPFLKIDSTDSTDTIYISDEMPPAAAPVGSFWICTSDDIITYAEDRKF